jgi:putative glutamine amidotransferase
MTKKNNIPIIGITTYGRSEAGNFYLPDGYVDGVRNAGGLPVLLPPGESNPVQILEVIDGLIFAGGGDIDPALYSGSNHPSIERIDPERDEFEIELAKKVICSNTPVLGICRGFQLLAIATGGDLISHVPDEIGVVVIHRADNSDTVEHSVRINQKGRLEQIIGTGEFPVMSKHHQAANTISNDWYIVAQAADDVIECIEHKQHPWMMAVLWHPELALEDERQQNLFKALVEAARRH